MRSLHSIRQMLVYPVNVEGSLNPVCWLAGLQEEWVSFRFELFQAKTTAQRFV